MDKLKKACDLRSFAKKMEPGKVTRRNILSAAHSLFDPIGFTCPFTIIPKMLLQEKCLIQKAGWDTDLSEDISRRFNAWLCQLTEVDKLRIPRCVVQSQDRRTWTFHIFMDSRNAAFAACAYLRSGFPGSVQVQFLMARSRVAPMKNTTIPRLELVACEIGSRLAVHIKSMMEFEDIPITLWTDSTTALAWIKRDMNWSVFVAGRVKKIRQNSSITDWRHVPGKENPADIPSLWLKKEEQFWKQSVEKESIEEVNSELRKAVVTHFNIEKRDMLAKITQFSNYHKIIRMVAYWRRFLDWLHRKRSNKITKVPVTMEEMTLAEEKVIRLVQQCSFEGVKDKKFKNLRVYEDESGLLRVKCRFVPVEKVDAHSYPMVMPSNGVTADAQFATKFVRVHVVVVSEHSLAMLKRDLYRRTEWSGTLQTLETITLDKKVEIRSTPIKEDAGREGDSHTQRAATQAARASHGLPRLGGSRELTHMDDTAIRSTAGNRRKMHIPDTRCMSQTQDACPRRKMHVPDARCMSQTQDACPRRKMHVLDARCMSQTQDACSRRKMHVPDARCMSQTQDACPRHKMHTQDACPRRKMHVLGARCMSQTQDACPRRKMHVPDIRCMSQTQDACPRRMMHVPDARCMSQTQDACPRRKMHVPDARCMSQTQDACPRRKMHVPDARCMSQTQDACPRRKMHVLDARCMSQTQDACPRRKMHVPDIRCMSQTQDACPRRMMHVPDARCMSQTHDACPRRKMHVPDARCMSQTQDSCPRRKMHVPDKRCMSQTQDACPRRKMHVLDARCMSQTQDACSRRKMHVPDARCMSQTQDAYARCMSQTKDACSRRKMHVPDARCMSQTQDACSRRKMHVPDARCMSQTQDACPRRNMHVPDARCMSQTQDACPRRKMHVLDARCMSQTQDACSRRKMHVPDARCMSQTQDACPRHKMHVPDARCMSQTHDACPRRKMHVLDARCMSQTKDACPRRKMHVPDARCMSQTHDACPRCKMHVLDARNSIIYRKRSKEKDFMAIRKSRGGATWGRWTSSSRKREDIIGSFSSSSTAIFPLEIKQI
ncbi:hypothetical protein LAZ67_8002343 [Cordylochernes scorpioides]|uniref:Uncharacterized protein n=1 Tax=Cordylochernes scorpioides TaxID=51811 RepID=A0ABY6KTM4_9ARAC|nr:hypothetical protein LAZ67_8002343 [Cordylochernes scorpioides]